MGNTRKNGLHLEKIGRTWKNGSHLENWITFGKMGNVSHLEKMVNTRGKTSKQ